MTPTAAPLGLPLGGPALLHGWHARISDYGDHARECPVCRHGRERCFIGTALYRSEQSAHARYQAAQVAEGVLYG